MFQEIWSVVSRALGLGLEAKNINVWQMSLRAVVVFVASIVMLQLGNKRFIMKRAHLTEGDLLEAMRGEGKPPGLA